MMSASCKFVTVLDYRKGLGHVDELSIDDGGRAQHDIRTEQWGLTTVKPGLIRPK